MKPLVSTAGLVSVGELVFSSTRAKTGIAAPGKTDISDTEFTGMVVQESLYDPDWVYRLNVLSKRQDTNNGWHVYYVQAFGDTVEKMTRHLRAKWYAHFWAGKQLIVVFKGKVFRGVTTDPDTHQAAVQYGLKQGIPLEQLDFPTF